MIPSRPTVARGRKNVRKDGRNQSQSQQATDEMISVVFVDDMMLMRVDKIGGEDSKEVGTYVRKVIKNGLK